MILEFFCICYKCCPIVKYFCHIHACIVRIYCAHCHRLSKTWLGVVDGGMMSRGSRTKWHRQQPRCNTRHCPRKPNTSEYSAVVILISSLWMDATVSSGDHDANSSLMLVNKLLVGYTGSISGPIYGCREFILTTTPILYDKICCLCSISHKICTRLCCALLFCGYAIIHIEFKWYICPYPSGLLHWHWGNRQIATVPVK